MEAANLTDKALWHVPGASSFLWRHFEDVWVVYDRRSGYTQVLNEFAREVLACLEERSLSFSALCDEFSSFLETPLTDVLREQLRDVLEDFDRKGLISPL